MNTTQIDTPSSDSSEDKSEQLIGGRYQIQKKLGAGSMGRVYLCRDTVLANEQVAVKILFRDLSDDPTYIARFQREVILARQLGHPNIVRVYDYGVTDDLEHYFTMELLTGGSLRDALKRKQLTPESAVRHFITIASAVSEAHSQDVVHRDLKPDNILFSSTGTLKVTDFGTARGAMAAQQNLTQTGDSLGTPIYMAPEIIQGARGDKKSDLYSLGILAHELVTGEPPFIANNWVALAALHVSKSPPEIADTQAPLWYREMVLKLLEKDPTNRFASAAELVEYIQANTVTRPASQGTSLLPLAFAGSVGAVVSGVLMSGVLRW
jgi:serine/threonine-protein kinase